LTGPQLTANDYILGASGSTKEFDDSSGVDNANLRVRRGTIHALIEPNGAGRTACFDLTKVLSQSRGNIAFNGTDITGTRSADIANLGIVRSFQISAVYQHLTGFENVRVAL